MCLSTRRHTCLHACARARCAMVRELLYARRTEYKRDGRMSELQQGEAINQNVATMAAQMRSTATASHNYIGHNYVGRTDEKPRRPQAPSYNKQRLLRL